MRSTTGGRKTALAFRFILMAVFCLSFHHLFLVLHFYNLKIKIENKIQHQHSVNYDHTYRRKVPFSRNRYKGGGYWCFIGNLLFGRRICYWCITFTFVSRVLISSFCSLIFTDVKKSNVLFNNYYFIYHNKILLTQKKSYIHV